MLKMDETVLLEPEREGEWQLFDPQGLPTDFTDCGVWIKVSGNAGVFEMRKPRKNDNDGRGRRGEMKKMSWWIQRSTFNAASHAMWIQR
jgi:hypothetical protein